MKRILFLLAAAAIALPARAADDAAALEDAALGFYNVYRTFHPSDGIPDDAGRARYRSYLSERLDGLLAQAADAEKRFAAKYKDSPPLLEGDVFTSLFEGATEVTVDTCSATGQTGHCAAHLRYAPPGDKPTEWTDMVYLVSTPAGWRVDDIGYGGTWAFGNKGRLSETLREASQFQ